MKSGYVKSLAIAGWMAFGSLPLLARAQLTDLGEATGYAINNAGQVVLSSGIYSNGTVTPLPALPGQTTPAVGAAINASGQVAGSGETQVTVSIFGESSADTQPGSVPIAYVNGTLMNISLSFSEYAVSGHVEPGYATGINASNQIVGYYTALNPRSEDPAPVNGFIYDNGAITELGACCAPYETPMNMPQAINDSGSVAGIFTVNDPNAANPGNSRFDAYVYSDGNMTDLGQGAAYAINAAGQVTGDLDVISLGGANGYTIAGSYAFLYSDGTTTNLGALSTGGSSIGYAINSTGQVVGDSDGHAFFYNGAMNDLNTLIVASDPLKPYVTLKSAVGINDSLLILANGVDSRTGKTHAYLYQGSFIQLAPAALDFAMLAVGGTSLAQSVTITNTGTTAIPIGTAYVNGDFSLRADNCGASLEPGSQCRISVVFIPKVVGVLSGVLTIPVGGANYQVPLSGIAPITAEISASGSTATVGQPATLTWTVSPGSTCTAASSSTNTAWTASNPPFTGTVAVSGKRTLTETVNGTVTYTLNCTAPGVAAVSASAAVVWNWPPVTLSISASPTTITAGHSTTITWTTSNATSCTATGGGPADMWAGAKATSGSQTITESFALETPSVVLTFGITCSSTVTGLSGQSSVNVTENRASSGSSGGAVSATITAAPTTITVRQSTTLTWTSDNSTSCSATGGGAGDGWGGTKATSGSQVVTETAALDTSSVVLTFGITCNSSSTGQSGKASVNVTENQAVAASGSGTTPAGPNSSGGGGALNWLSLAFLAGILAARRYCVSGTVST
jgi:probable HAF family extracellular repeat protein